MKKRYVLYLIVCVFFAGCASSVQDLQRESARNISSDLKPNDVTINNVKRSAMSVSWQAVVSDGTIYNCDADDMVRRVNCGKQ